MEHAQNTVCIVHNFVPLEYLFPYRFSNLPPDALTGPRLTMHKCTQILHTTHEPPAPCIEDHSDPWNNSNEASISKDLRWKQGSA